MNRTEETRLGLDDLKVLVAARRAARVQAMMVTNKKEAQIWEHAWRQSGGLNVGVLKGVIAGLKRCHSLSHNQPDMRAGYHDAVVYLEGVLEDVELQRELEAREQDRMDEARHEAQEMMMDLRAAGKDV